ncbi:unnamed protein product [Bemisia tabaci]|uniref:THAP-type domain-containing protein n=1 Tax=Bemisia tabaci TaxID=7038 RepID=A0A9P0F4C3_BEMTA|nr:unnamed protein product [Bemisia tabaci]
MRGVKTEEGPPRSKCSATGCPTQTGDPGVHIKRFPKDESRRKEWANRIYRPDWQPTIHHFLCEELRKFTVEGKFIIDFNVRNKTQQFRMLYSTKLFPNKETHPLLPVDATFKLSKENIHKTLVQVARADEGRHTLSSHRGVKGSLLSPLKRTLYNPGSMSTKFNPLDVIPNEASTTASEAGVDA